MVGNTTTRLKNDIRYEEAPLRRKYSYNIGNTLYHHLLAFIEPFYIPVIGCRTRIIFLLTLSAR